ncbi:hypothetical protein QMK33_13820 [Hymenobacter sp. H14-R3]|uniref:XAC2610-related protein n=1 Tax=Hymenobacter sp. H14-R3 TaxID=3046308 RepID=UPI0024BBC8BC|nr:hypothetical protein [Hymenobacter sp. H14-R3]MDJ0366232.1 hypothetical protein [Hymenobacter sp. H14-R3]
MIKYSLAIFCLITLAASAARGQAAYVGTVGTAPIELTLNSVGDGELAGVYLYTKIGTPIKLSGRLKQGALTLTEPDAHGKPAATLTVASFAAGAARLTGTWRSLATGRQLPLVLARPSQPAQHGLLQAEALKDSYFKMVLVGKPGKDEDQPTAVQLLEKKTNRVLQQLPVEVQPMGIYSVQVGDYNFDGLPDFSVFESTYAGPNTTSLYYLYDPARQRYVASGYEGTSLKFDPKKRRVYEHNSCCAGSSVINVEYKVLNNKLVTLARHCYRWDEKKQELVERPFSACQ